MKTPAFQFYPKQWLGDDNVMLMSMTARGMHIQLMCIAWQQSDCGLPDDDDMLRSWSLCSVEQWPSMKTQIFRAWKLLDGRWFNEGLLRERSKQDYYKEKKGNNAQNRWGENACETPAKRLGIVFDDDTKARITRSERLAAARRRGTHSTQEFAEMLVFFKGKCVKCGSEKDIVKDHIVPIYKGGSDSISNIQPLCRKCNAAKGPDCTDFRKTSAKTPAKWLRNDLSSSTSSSSTSVNKVLPETETDDPTEIIHRTLAGIVPNHPKPSPLPWAVSAVEREVASNHLDAKEFCEALKKTHVEHCKIYERELAENPRAFVPLFHKWVSDGYYLHRPSNRDPPVKKPSYAQAVAAGLVTNLEEYERRFHA